MKSWRQPSASARGEVKAEEAAVYAHVKAIEVSINGKQSDITDDDLLAVAERYGIGTAPRVLSEVKAAVR